MGKRGKKRKSLKKINKSKSDKQNQKKFLYYIHTKPTPESDLIDKNIVKQTPLKKSQQKHFIKMSSSNDKCSDKESNYNNHPQITGERKAVKKPLMQSGINALTAKKQWKTKHNKILQNTIRSIKRRNKMKNSTPLNNKKNFKKMSDFGNISRIQRTSIVKKQQNQSVSSLKSNDNDKKFTQNTQNTQNLNNNNNNDEDKIIIIDDDDDDDVDNDNIDEDDEDCIIIEPKIINIDLVDSLPSTSHDDLVILQNTEIIHKNQKYYTIKSNKSFLNNANDDETPTTTCILLDDTICTNTTPDLIPLQSENSANKNNESVIILENTICDSTLDDSAPDFIPLDPVITVTNDKVNPTTRNVNKNGINQNAILQNNLFTKKEKKALIRYNYNAYNPNPEKNLKDKKRVIIIDGSNVAITHSTKRIFSVKGLSICIDYFMKNGHEVKAVVPQFRLKRHQTDNPDEFEKLKETGVIVLTPSKNLPGQCAASYDDRIILQLASEMDAAIISNDNYRDLIHESPAFKKIVENRVIGYTWCNDIFMLPKDPYGKFGPPLEQILYR